ncbi:hypothetical protein JST99_00075 [Candidatus Dependentiae bacterium]|nr:hypothetical protein [Candidatus Dependentiae bacterium]MCC7414604.1 hypothetical protein [Campylobacterota bacterium]
MKNIRVQIKALLYVLILITTSSLVAQAVQHNANSSVDVVIFSYHRPAQLYALCESLQQHVVSGCGVVSVIYRADTDDYRAAYEVVRADFPDFVFLPQGNDPRADFKPLTLQAAFDSPAEYVVFAVDDIIVKDTLDFAQCVQALQKTNAYGFYLRLGTNLTECYMLSCAQPLPRLQRLTPSIIAWQLSRGKHDWGYPNTVDMTIYRKAAIKQALFDVPYEGPNQLEGHWAQKGVANHYAIGLCYIQSKIVNIPCNRVQEVYGGNRFMHSLTTQELLDLFLAGKKIAIEDFAQVNNTAAHAEYPFRFIDR